MRKYIFRCALVLATLLMAASCKNSTKNSSETSMTDSAAPMASTTQSSFGTLPDGTKISLYLLKNTLGTEMAVTNLGGVIVSLKTSDRSGVFEDIVLGYDSLSGYLKAPSFFGALVGRYGNRIAKGKFTLDGNTYTLARNNGENHLHGGLKGFDKVVWNATPAVSENGASLKLTYVSKDMEEGYPGTLDVEVTYTLTNKNELKIEYNATTDKKTIINLTNHTYFNLSGNTKRDILNEVLSVSASKYIPVDKTLIPTGEIESVSGTPFDFTSPTVIGSRINDDHPQLLAGKGYDHCWVFDKNDESLSLGATLYDPVSGRYMEMYTTEPGTQVYTGNFLDGTITGKYNTVYKQRYAICLETQHFPDSPNQPNFPPVVLKPGDVYKTQTIYKFSTK
ncbi:MAG: galactose mutarotase [Cyclobacteriaceae bacterium]|nr:galactose mutarotase [Cyclobacteriaceae bacterium]MDH4295842.1 galactose mutarotase [Cyclobacteriaceae bacterium]MDH5247686.1 galactose mutarotase [Cyclobacteriaceae bacterium]